ncbi:hypothetical protein ASG78_12335 [Nostocoides sp. Soil756]|nr:hypothetical protein ASG78_12335 [Tetrasphaera sp. Soil756]
MMSDRRRAYTVTGAACVEAPVGRVYAALLNPDEQLRWNSLYLQAEMSTPEPIATGSVMTGRFKQSGRSVITFDAVVPNETFTHKVMMKAGPIALGSFAHTYRVQAVPTGTEVTQHVRFEPTGLGRLLAPLIMKAFEARLPVSFHELEQYLS